MLKISVDRSTTPNITHHYYYIIPPHTTVSHNLFFYYTIIESQFCDVKTVPQKWTHPIVRIKICWRRRSSPHPILPHESYSDPVIVNTTTTTMIQYFPFGIPCRHGMHRPWCGWVMRFMGMISFMYHHPHQQ